MIIYTIYDHPNDHPNSFVCRRYEVIVGFPEPFPREIVAIGLTLKEVQDKLPEGLALIPKDPNDDPKIVESWL